MTQVEKRQKGIKKDVFDNVQVLISPNTNRTLASSRPSALRILPRSLYEDTIILAAPNQDGEMEEFVVPEIVARSSKLIVNMLGASGGAFKEQVERKVSLPEISSSVLEEILKFLHQDFLENPLLHLPNNESGTSSTPRVHFQFQIRPEILMDILAAAHFLELSILSQYSISMLAHNIESIPLEHNLPNDTLQRVCEECSAYDLFKMEEMGLLEGYQVDIQALWRKLAEKKNWADVIISQQLQPVEKWWTKESKENQMGNLIDWKRGYIECEIHRVASINADKRLKKICFNLGSSLQSFKVAFFPKNLYILDELPTFLPNLRSLDLSYSQIDNFEPLAKTLNNFKLLTTLKMAKCGINARVMTTWCEIVRTLAKENGVHPLSKVTHLDLSENAIDCVAIEKLILMVSGISLEYLNLSNNSIDSIPFDKKISPSGFSLLARWIGGNFEGCPSVLKWLDLTSCNLSVSAINERDIPSLTRAKTLLGLRLSFNALPESDKAGNLLNALSRMPSLEVLHMANCRSSCQQLINGLFNRASLMEGEKVALCDLDISYNEIPHAHVLSQLAELLTLTPVGDDPSKQSGSSSNPVKNVALNRSGISLKHVDISGNSAVSDSVVQIFASRLKDMSSLETLGWKYTKISSEGVLTFDRAVSQLPKESSLKCIDLRGARPTVEPPFDERLPLQNPHIILLERTPLAVTYNVTTYSMRYGGGL
eukprot:TRINITY_DN675_c0_g1_i2.p1 TRINITY_DN675_c0_g1~~TRINITY_DN675_c0_g1_i2.p1  ORF type:complete len:711 (+),score=145.43 TRINITY_DN675_c0_g1_i2:156-2288(+)